MGEAVLHQSPTDGAIRSLFRRRRSTAALSFDPLFHPRGIAIIGASADLSRIGGHPIKALKAAG
jgi:hypothetical protein